MAEIDTGGSAFPETQQTKVGGDDGLVITKVMGGMTLREFAAIKLRVPRSGRDWLDEMIIESLQDDFAGQALAGVYQRGSHTPAFDSYELAQAMLAEKRRLEQEAGGQDDE